MLRAIKWTLVAIGGLVLLGGGASIFSQPEAEVLYSANPPTLFCAAGACYGMYTIDVGNTGTTVQPQVRVRLRAAALASSALTPQVRGFGKVPRAAVFEERDGERIYQLNQLKPGERVDIRLFLHAPAGAPPPAWDEMLIAVESDGGEVRPGDAASITFGRVLFTFFAGC